MTDAHAVADTEILSDFTRARLKDSSSELYWFVETVCRRPAETSARLLHEVATVAGVENHLTMDNLELCRHIRSRRRWIEALLPERAGRFVKNAIYSAFSGLSGTGYIEFIDETWAYLVRTCVLLHPLHDVQDPTRMSGRAYAVALLKKGVVPDSKTRARMQYVVALLQDLLQKLDTILDQRSRLDMFVTFYWFGYGMFDAGRPWFYAIDDATRERGGRLRQILKRYLHALGRLQTSVASHVKSVSKIKD